MRTCDAVTTPRFQALADLRRAQPALLAAARPIRRSEVPYEDRHRRRFDAEERHAIRHADVVQAELVSPESHGDVDGNGYEDDGFCVTDQDLPLQYAVW
jgi:hypothetical protein